MARPLSNIIILLSNVRYYYYFARFDYLAIRSINARTANRCEYVRLSVGMRKLVTKKKFTFFHAGCASIILLIFFLFLIITYI